MGPYAGVDYSLTLCPLQSRLQHIYHEHPYVTVDLNPIPESTLSPCQELWIWPLATNPDLRSAESPFPHLARASMLKHRRKVGQKGDCLKSRFITNILGNGWKVICSNNNCSFAVEFVAHWARPVDHSDFDIFDKMEHYSVFFDTQIFGKTIWGS